MKNIAQLAGSARGKKNHKNSLVKQRKRAADVHFAT